MYGPPGVGKTFAALTLSAHLPADFSCVVSKTIPKRDPVELKDMLWIAFDSGATRGFKQHGISVPLLDLSQSGDNILNDRRDAVAIATKRVASGETTTIVVDTVSAFDEILTYYWRNKGLEKWDLFGAIKYEHFKFALPLKALKCNILFLCHAKALMDPVDANQAAKVQASGFAKIVPAITGDALNHYRKDSSFIFPVLQEKIDGIQKRVFYTTPTKGFEAKARVALPDVVPADWREVLKQI